MNSDYEREKRALCNDSFTFMNKKNVGIITYAHYDNYGTMLQAYALQKLIENEGFEASIIDFKPDASLSKKELTKIRIKNIPHYLKNFLKYKDKLNDRRIMIKNSEWLNKRHDLFEDFYVSYIHSSVEKYTNSMQLKQMPPIYDAYVVGSDQTWNPYVSRGPEAFFLTFVADNNKKGSYAPSLTVTNLSDELVEKYKKHLSSFYFLSCRERTGASLLSSIIGRPVKAVLDPTLLLNNKHWDSIASSRIIKGEYILSYFLGNVPEHRIFVKWLSEILSLQVVSIPMSPLEFRDNSLKRLLAGPKEFLALIRDAKYVCTDSFHGTILSINYGVEFFSFYKANDDVNTQNNRLFDVLEMLELTKRIVKGDNPSEYYKYINDQINYVKINTHLDALRKQSSLYLTNMLIKLTKKRKSNKQDDHIDFDFSKECYGCASCSTVCPSNAIQMKDGIIPVIDENKCIKCGRCTTACLRYREPCALKPVWAKQGYVCRNKDNQILKTSSSGGVFFELAKYAIDQGWYVSGCIYDDNQIPIHTVTNSLEIVRLMQGSKYVQSRTDYAFKDIVNLHNSGKKILFSGVPCQIAAIQKILGESNMLITVAVACHGSIDRKYWRDYLDSKREKYGNIKSVTMRDKSRGWLNYGLKIMFESGKVNITYRNEKGYFLKAYTSGLFERERCLYCTFKGSRIYADILLADAWGMERNYPDICSEKGASVVICITEKGEKWFTDVKTSFDVNNVKIEDIINHNQRIVSPAPINPLREEFQSKIIEEPKNIESYCKKYTQNSIMSVLGNSWLVSKAMG